MLIFYTSLKEKTIFAEILFYLPLIQYNVTCKLQSLIANFRKLRTIMRYLWSMCQHSSLIGVGLVNGVWDAFG